MRAVERVVEIDGVESQVLDQIAEVCVSMALDGDMRAIQEVGDRVDGKVPQAITGPNGDGPIQLEVIIRDLFAERMKNEKLINGKATSVCLLEPKGVS